MRRGVSPVAQPGSGQGASSFSCSTPAETANPGPGHLHLRCVRETSTSGPKLREVLSPQPDRTPRPEPDKRAPLFTPHTGFQCPRPAAPRSSSSRTPAPRPGRRRRAGPSRRPPLPTMGEGRLPLSPDSHHTPTASSPPPPTTARSRGPSASSGCFVSDVKSRPQELPGAGPAQKASPLRHFRLWSRWRPACRRRGGT